MKKITEHFEISNIDISNMKKLIISLKAGIIFFIGLAYLIYTLVI